MRVRLNHAALSEILSRTTLSQNNWAMKLGLSSGHLADLVNGKHPFPSPITREKLVAGLGVTFDSLFTIESPEATVGGSTDFQSRFQAGVQDRYVIDRVIGQGGMGTVYQARDVKHGRLVAMKVILPDAISQMGNAAFLQEIRRTAQLQHPNILPLLDSGEAAECPYLVTPFVRDGSLADVIEDRKRLPPQEVVGYLRGICAALQHAHDQHVLHCDVKPDNVLISGGQAVVMDFGISKAIHLDGRVREPAMDTSSGTPSYVSPEQASGDRVDAQSDQYSVACVAFELLTGHRPFEGPNDVAIVSQRFLSAPPDVRTVVPEVPAPVAAALRRAMSFDAPRRFRSTQEFFEAFTEAAEVSHEAIRWRQRRDRARRSLDKGARAVLRGTLGARRSGAVLNRVRARATRRAQQQLSNRWFTGGGVMAAFRQDVLYALRNLRSQPGFALVAVLTLALGVGANTAIFSVVNALILRPLPYYEPDRLVTIWEVGRSGSVNHVTGPNFVDWRAQATTFEDMTVNPTYAFGGRVTILGGDEPVRVWAGAISAGFFRVFPLQPVVGRVFRDDEFQAGAAPVALISYRFWRNQFGEETNLERRSLALGSRSFQIVGVLPPGFTYPQDTDLWIPATGLETETSRTSHNWGVTGRLRPDVTLEQARQELSQITRQLAVAYEGEITAADARVTLLQEELVGSVKGPLRLLLGAAGLLLLVACSNVASTLLAQGTARERELSIRTALGANRTRIVRQLFTESILLAGLGAVSGIVLAAVMVRWFASIAPPGIALDSSSFDFRVWGFALGITLTAAVAFGLYPAFRSAASGQAGAMRGGSRGNAVSMRGGPWTVLMGVEAALAVMLLVGSGLLIRSFWEVVSIDPGFDADGVVTIDISLPGSKYPDDPATIAFYDQAFDRLSAVPGVQSVGVINHLPMSGSSINGGFTMDGGDDDVGNAAYRAISGGYFAAMGIPILQGRTFDSRDHGTVPHTVIVNRTLADHYFPEGNAVGNRIRRLRNDSWIYGEDWMTIIGVVGDVRHGGLTNESRAEVYVHYQQRPFRLGAGVLTMRVNGDMASVVEAARTTLQEQDKDVPLSFSTVRSFVDETVAGRRFTMIILGAFGAVGLLLAMVGIYGVVSYAVARRSREMGIRLALGAAPASVRRMVQRGALVTVLVGIGVGLGSGALLSGVMQDLLFGVSPVDPWTFVGVGVVLFASAWFASYTPARRSTRVDPMVAMRSE